MYTVYMVIFFTVVLTKECEKWDKKTEIKNIWKNFQANFFNVQRRINDVSVIWRSKETSTAQ